MNADAPVFEPLQPIPPHSADAQSAVDGASQRRALAEKNSQLAVNIERLEYENELLRLKAKKMLSPGSGGFGSTLTASPAKSSCTVPRGIGWWPGMSPWAVPGGEPWVCASGDETESTMAPSEQAVSFTGQRRRGGSALGDAAAVGRQDRGFSSDAETLESIAPPPGLEDPRRAKTTVMMRNIPFYYMRSKLLGLLDEHGFSSCCYDMVYLPIDFGSGTGFGYAFINFVSNAEAERFKEHFQGFKNWFQPSDKVCEVDWSCTHQSLAAHIARYRNSPVMHESVPDEHKPMLFEQGIRVDFPAPTKKLRPPRARNRP